VGADPVLLVLLGRRDRPGTPPSGARPHRDPPRVLPRVAPGGGAARRLASAGTQTLRSDEPERSARLVWPEVPAAVQRALEHVPFAWTGLQPGRPETLYHPLPAR